MKADGLYDKKDILDYLILGAGPAGIQLGYFLHQKNRNYLILERGAGAGTFFKEFPRHRKMISINKIFTGIDSKEINLRWDWNSLLTDDFGLEFSEFSQDYFPSADAYTDYLTEFSKKYSLAINYNVNVVHVSKQEYFVVKSSDNRIFYAKRLIIASGLSKMNLPDIPGIHHCMPYTDYPIDPDLYRNKRVMVIGKGNSALETADSLINTTAVIHLISPNPIKLAWKTHYVGNLRAVNNNYLDTYQLKSQNTIIDAVITRIHRLDDGRLEVFFVYNHAQNQQASTIVDCAIACTGFKFDSSIFDIETCLPKTCYGDKYPQVSVEWESTNIPDLYFAGTLMHSRDYKKSFSGFVHGFRYNIKCLHHIFERRYDGANLDFTLCNYEAESILQHIINRVCHNSSLFQQPAFFSDVLLLPPAAGSHFSASVKCYRDLPVDYVMSLPELSLSRRLVITLEYGNIESHVDPFNIPRIPNDGFKSAFIHPVIKYYHVNDVISEYHIPEDLENEWYKPMYCNPFRDFLEHIIVGESQNTEAQIEFMQ